MYCHDGVCYHNEAAGACYIAHKGCRERVDPIQSLVINMAINAYPIVTGGVTIQYDQNTVRLIHRSNTSLVAPAICEGKKAYSMSESPGANNERRTYLRQRQGRRRRQQKHLAEYKDRTGVGT
jgi:hypothetical protein